MLCRLCLNESNDYLYIFGAEGDERGDKLEVSEIIWKYIHIQIKARDRVSNTICRSCWQQLYKFHQFCLNIIEKQELLKHQKQQNQVPTNSHSSFNTQSVVEDEIDYNENDVDVKNVLLYEPQTLRKFVKNETTHPPAEVHRGRLKSKRIKGELCSEKDFKGVTKARQTVVQSDVHDPLSNENNISSVTKKQKIINNKKLKPTKNPKDGDALFEQQIDEKSETKNPIFAESILKTSVGTAKLHNDDDDEDDFDNDDDFTWPMDATYLDKKKRKSRRKQDNSELSIPKSFSLKKKREEIESDMLLPSHMTYTDAEMDVFIAQHASLKCSLCEENLLDFHHLKRHYRDKHQCEGYAKCCKKRFSARTLFVDHLKRHFDPKFISCVICNKSVSNRGALRRHFARFHPKEKDLKYECNKCSLKFTKDYLRIQHIKLYHPPDEDMKYKCEDCGGKFPTAKFLRQHRKEKHKSNNGKKDLTAPQQDVVPELPTVDMSLNYSSVNLHTECNTQNLYSFTNPYTYHY